MLLSEINDQSRASCGPGQVQEPALRKFKQKDILRGKLSNKRVAEVFVNSNGETSLLRLAWLLIVLVASSCHSYFRSRVSLLIFSINEPFSNKYLEL